MSLMQNWTYEPQPFLPYPTCRLKKGFGEDIELADFAFVSKLAYSTDANTQVFLDQWFGPGYAYNNVTLVNEFKEDQKEITFGSAVSYKLITFRANGQEGGALPSAVLSIRGTQTIWDLMADAQLWIAAGLFQGLRFFLPFSEIFTPILNQMVWMVSQLETTAIMKVSFYRETTAFVYYLKNRGARTIEITGHSLGKNFAYHFTKFALCFSQLIAIYSYTGGGLAIITGALSRTNAVAISGVNAKLSRDTFYDPYSDETVKVVRKLTQY